MSEEKTGSDVVVWGIPVVTADIGRRIWPDALKAMAAEKVAAGAKVVTVAKEIGANESLVAKWARADLPARSRKGASGESTTLGKDAPQFVEVMAASEPVRSRPRADATEEASCRIRIGDAEISVGGDVPPARLAEILRAVRITQ